MGFLMFACTATMGIGFYSSNEIMTIGGDKLLKQAIPLTNTLYLTEIQTRIDGDTF